MSSRISNPGLVSAVIWSGVIICEMRYPRYSITPVTRETGTRAPGSPENIPDNREYFNINISPQLNIITRHRRHTSVSIQIAVQTRAAGVGKCPNCNPSMLHNAMEINR